MVKNNDRKNQLSKVMSDKIERVDKTKNERKIVGPSTTKHEQHGSERRCLIGGEEQQLSKISNNLGVNNTTLSEKNKKMPQKDEVLTLDQDAVDAIKKKKKKRKKKEGKATPPTVECERRGNRKPNFIAGVKELVKNTSATSNEKHVSGSRENDINRHTKTSVAQVENGTKKTGNEVALFSTSMCQLLTTQEDSLNGEVKEKSDCLIDVVEAKNEKESTVENALTLRLKTSKTTVSKLDTGDKETVSITNNRLKSLPNVSDAKESAVIISYKRRKRSRDVVKNLQIQNHEEHGDEGCSHTSTITEQANNSSDVPVPKKSKSKSIDAHQTNDQHAQIKVAKPGRKRKKSLDEATSPPPSEHNRYDEEKRMHIMRSSKEHSNTPSSIILSRKIVDGQGDDDVSRTSYKSTESTDIQTVNNSPPTNRACSDQLATRQGVVSPSTQSTSSGDAVSTDEHAKKSLQFNEEDTSHLVSIKKYFQPSKELKQKEKKRHVKSKRETLKSKSKSPLGNAEGKVDIDVGETPHKQGHIESLEMDVASALCTMNSVGKHREVLEENKTLNNSDEKTEDHSSQRFSQIKDATEVFNQAVLPVSLSYRNSGLCNNFGTFSVTGDNSQKQFNERRKMIFHHRASHERLRNAILSSAQKISSDSRRSRDIKNTLYETLSEYEVMLREMLSQQQMEATTLAATQSLESGNGKAPVVKVSFPFPDVFNIAQDIALKNISASEGQLS